VESLWSCGTKKQRLGKPEDGGRKPSEPASVFALHPAWGPGNQPIQCSDTFICVSLWRELFGSAVLDENGFGSGGPCEGFRILVSILNPFVDCGFEFSYAVENASPCVVRCRMISAKSYGEKEAKLIALACSEPPKGRARWTLRLSENKVVELNIVDRASDSTIGRTLKKHSQAASETAMGYPAEGQ
jgi:hypothetical protein